MQNGIYSSERVELDLFQSLISKVWSLFYLSEGSLEDPLSRLTWNTPYTKSLLPYVAVKTISQVLYLCSCLGGLITIGEHRLTKNLKENLKNEMPIVALQNSDIYCWESRRPHACVALCACWGKTLEDYSASSLADHKAMVSRKWELTVEVKIWLNVESIQHTHKTLSKDRKFGSSPLRKPDQQLRGQPSRDLSGHMWQRIQISH